MSGFSSGFVNLTRPSGFKVSAMRKNTIFLKQCLFKPAVSASYPVYQLESSAKIFSGTRFFSTSTESAATKSLRDRLKNELSAIKGAGLYKSERVIKTPQGVIVQVQGYQSDMLNFCANNYLGLSSHPDVVAAGKTALDDFGAGLSSVRFICGTQTIHKDLENKISKFHERQDTILYASCFDANAGIFEVLCSSPDDAILSDELNHASIIDGIRLCKAKKYRYTHRDMNDLENKLKEAQSARTRLIVTDGVFSMDGNVAPLPDIVALAKKYNAITFIDECHATGFFGPTGRGTEEYFGLPLGTVDIVNSTLGKALGGAAGGYTSACQEIVDLLRQRSRPYLFSNSLPPPVVASGAKVIDMLLASPELPQKLRAGTKHFRNAMKMAGFNVAGDPSHPICPVMLGDARLTADFARKMQERGIYVVGFSYPVVPKGKARIRVQISAAHSKEDIEKAVDAFKAVGKELAAISA